MEEKELLIGPLLTKNGRLSMIGIDEIKVHLITTNWVTSIKYLVSVQLPLFNFSIDKLLKKSIAELNESHKTKVIDHSKYNKYTGCQV